MAGVIHKGMFSLHKVILFEHNGGTYILCVTHVNVLKDQAQCPGKNDCVEDTVESIVTVAIEARHLKTGYNATN